MLLVGETLYPPPNHPDGPAGGGAATRVKPPPVIVNPPDIVKLILFKPLSYCMPEVDCWRDTLSDKLPLAVAVAVSVA